LTKGKPGIIYNLLVKLQTLEYYNLLIDKKIVPSNWHTYKLIYEYYIEQRQTLKGKVLITKIVDHFYISPRSVYAIIEKMEG